MRLRYPRVGGDGLVFREDFTSWKHVADNGGIVTPAGTSIRSSGGLIVSDDTSTTGLVQYANVPLLRGGQSFTVIVELVPLDLGTAGAYNILLHWGTNLTNKGYVIGLFNQQLLALPWGTAATSLGAVTVNQNMHLCAVYDRTAGTAKLGVNGALVTAPYAAALAGSTTKLSISGTTVAALRGFKALYKRVRIYDKAFTASEVLKDYREVRT